MEIGRIIKLLNLTQSENDNEALSAMRQVNRAMREAKVTWEKVFEGAHRASAMPPERQWSQSAAYRDEVNWQREKAREATAHEQQQAHAYQWQNAQRQRTAEDDFLEYLRQMGLF